MISVAQHIDRQAGRVDVELSEERNVNGDIHRVLRTRDSETGDIAIFLTTEQAEQIAVTILSRIKADRKAGLEPVKF